MDSALYFPQQDNWDLNNIFLSVKTSVQFLLKGVRYRHGNHRTVGLWKCYAKQNKTKQYTHAHIHTCAHSHHVWEVDRDAEAGSGERRWGMGPW